MRRPGAGFRPLRSGRCSCAFVGGKKPRRGVPASLIDRWGSQRTSSRFWLRSSGAHRAGSGGLGRRAARGLVAALTLVAAIAGESAGVALLPAAASASPVALTAYVTSGTRAGGTLVPIDVASNTVGSPIAVPGTNPNVFAVAITPDNKTAYVATGNSTSVPIDLASGTAGSPIAVGSFPIAIAITPNGKTAYVVNLVGNSVTAIDVASNAVVATVAVGSRPRAIAITPDNRTAYVSNSSSNSVTAIDVASNTPVATIPVGSVPWGIAITPDGKTAYVVDSGNASLTPIDVATNTAGSSIAAAGADRVIAITPDGKTAYFSDFNGVTPIDLASAVVGTKIPTGNLVTAIPITPDGRTAYVVNNSDATVTPVDLTTNTAGSALSLFGSGAAITWGTPSITTTSSGPAAAGGAVSDVATVSGGATGRVTFSLYAPGDTSCATPISTTTGTLSGGSASSGNVAVGGAGNYNWVATYAGDAYYNNPASSPCGSEPVTVGRATPTIATTPSGTVAAGGSVSDVATVSGGYNPGGQVTFSLYVPGDTSCATPISTTTGTLSGGSASSGNVAVGGAGTYNWVATYTGDANNSPASSPCGSESVSVTYPFAGFLPPVDNPPAINSRKAGAAVPVKFSLGGNQGLNIFASGFPASQQFNCATGVPIGPMEPTVTAGSPGLSYDSSTGQYTYVWKTDSAWLNTCRSFDLRLSDDTDHFARFQFS